MSQHAEMAEQLLIGETGGQALAPKLPPAVRRPSMRQETGLHETGHEHEAPSQGQNGTPTTNTARRGPKSASNPLPPAEPPMLLTVAQVEAALQLGRTRTYELLRSGEIPVRRVGRLIRVSRRALEEWVAQRAETPQG